VAKAEEAQQLASQLTRGVGADKAIVTVDIVNEGVVQAAFDVIRKGGTEGNQPRRCPACRRLSTGSRTPGRTGRGAAQRLPGYRWR
jgi:hypothetical protein